MRGAGLESLDLDDDLRRCGRGDRAALRRIYDAEGPRMLGVALRILRRQQLAEEAVHDAFVQVWQRAESFDPGRGGAKTWLYAVLRNRALNILRGEARTDLVEDFEPMGLASAEEDPESVMARLSDAGALRRCLERLEPARGRIADPRGSASRLPGRHRCGCTEARIFLRSASGRAAAVYVS